MKYLLSGQFWILKLGNLFKIEKPLNPLKYPDNPYK